MGPSRRAKQGKFSKEGNMNRASRENTEGLSIREPSVNIGKEVCESMEYEVPAGGQGVVIKGNEAGEVGRGQVIQCKGQFK